MLLLESCLQTCMLCTIAECTVNINSWWWTEELSETCRVSCQNKFVKLVHLVDNRFIVFHTRGVSWISKMFGFITPCLTTIPSSFKSFRSVYMHVFGLCYFLVSRDKLYASSRNAVSISVTDCTTDNACFPFANSFSFCYDKRDLWKIIFISVCFIIIF
jgi:hypothetical protein